MSDRRNTIHLVSVVLTNAVEMQTSTIVGKSIVNSDNDSVTPIRENSWSGECAIDKQNVSGNSIECSCRVDKLEVILKDW